MTDEFPELTIFPEAGEADVPPPDPASGTFDLRKPLIAVAIEDPNLAAEVAAALSAADHLVGGFDLIEGAWTVIADCKEDVAGTLAMLRARMQPSAALIMLVGEGAHADVPQAYRLGAFACLRQPVVREELLATARAANTSRNNLEQLAEMSRALDVNAHLASLGRVTAGISHEIANPLAVIALQLEVIAEDWRAAEQRLAMLDGILAAGPDELGAALTAARAASTTPCEGDVEKAVSEASASCRRIDRLLHTMRELVFARPRVREAISLEQVARTCIGLCPVDLVEGIGVEVAVEAAVEVLADRTVLEQLLLNLLTNAAHAVRGVAAPRIRVHVYHAGDGSVISVRDNGPGVAPNLTGKIFEPFFTTRRGSGGTGLGLALCREYARQMGAALTLWTSPGRGACFRLTFQRTGVPRTLPNSARHPEVGFGG